MSTTIQSVSLPNGIRLPYVEQGDPNGIPVVLLHGYSDALHSWDLIRPLLPPSFRVIALSMRGHGDASQPEAGYGSADFASDLVAFLDALAIESAVIVGHSLGTLVAARFAEDYPERTRALVLIGALTSLSRVPGFEVPGELVAAVGDPVYPDFIREFQESTIANPLPPDFFALVLRESAKLTPGVWKNVAFDLTAEDRTEELSRIAAPTLILWGDRDETALRSEQEILAASIAGSQHITYDGFGHALHWEAPERVARDLIEFIRGL